MDLLKWHKYNVECAHENEYELTPYLVEDKNAPVIIVLPGGGYRMIASFIEGEPVAKYFQSQGINAFVLRYRVKEKAFYPNPIEDIVHALTDIKDNYKLSLDNYALCGFSAGGHMAALFGVKEIGYGKYNLPKPNMLMLCYPVTSMDKDKSHKSSLKWFTSSNSEEAFKYGNVYEHITSDYPRTFIWRGDNDKSVPPINSDLLVESLDKNNVDHKFYKFKKAPHGIGLGEKTEASIWPETAVKYWLNK